VAVKAREPGQVRKEAALSGHLQAPRGRRAGVKRRGSAPGTGFKGGCTVNAHFRSCRENQLISGYVDIHAHLLPVVDDGPPDLDQALEMASTAVASGIATIVATPHLNSMFPKVRPEQIAARCRHLSAKLERRGIPLRVVPGAEVAIGWAVEASDDQLALASYGQRGTDLLIETPFDHAPQLDEFLSALHEKGYRVTLGHPERSSYFQHDLRAVHALVEMGVLLQVNAESLLGAGTRRDKRVAQKLVGEGVAHAIASDAHRAHSWRPVTRLADAVRVAAELVGADRAQWMAAAAPAAIVEGRALPPPPSLQRPRRRHRLLRSGW
jgi:protein-tyrosine phosphatase